MIRLIAFDLDGTLIDSRRDIADSANELLSHYGAPPLTLDAVVSAQQDLGEHFDRVLRAQGAGVEWMSQAWQAWQAWINLGLALQPLAAPRAA